MHGRPQEFLQGGKVYPLPFLSIPLFLSLPFFSHPSTPLLPALSILPCSFHCALSITPFLFRCEAVPLNSGGVWERYKLPSGVFCEAPAEIEIAKLNSTEIEFGAF